MSHFFAFDRKIFLRYTSGMEQPQWTGKPRGRPRGTGKPKDEKYVLMAFRAPPALRDELAALVPEQERSAFIRRLVERALASERRRQAKGEK